jgi:hypothetical protein
MTNGFSFRKGNLLSIMLLNRSFYSEAPVEVILPAEATGPAKVYTLTGDSPKAHNREGLNVRVEESSLNASGNQLSTSIPAGSVQVLVVEVE